MTALSASETELYMFKLVTKIGRVWVTSHYHASVGVRSTFYRSKYFDSRAPEREMFILIREIMLLYVFWQLYDFFLYYPLFHIICKGKIVIWNPVAKLKSLNTIEIKVTSIFSFYNRNIYVTYVYVVEKKWY